MKRMIAFLGLVAISSTVNAGTLIVGTGKASLIQGSEVIKDTLGQGTVVGFRAKDGSTCNLVIKTECEALNLVILSRGIDTAITCTQPTGPGLSESYKVTTGTISK